MFLSKKMAELERSHNELEKLNYTLNNKLNLALTEKEQLKQQISTLKNQLKITNEMSGEINLRNHIQDKYGIGASQPQTTEPSGRRMTNLADRRAEIKNAKRVGKKDLNLSGIKTPRNNVDDGLPKVIPIEDDDEDVVM